MQVTGNLQILIRTETGTYEPVGTATKEWEAASVKEAQEEGREWIRRNRASNPEVTALRYKLELLAGGVCMWEYDETKDDPILEPTFETVVACPC